MCDVVLAGSNDRLCQPVAMIVAVFMFSDAAHAETALGSADASVTLVEYGSLTCDYCVRFHRRVLPCIKSRHIDTGRVRFIYRDFPTNTAATSGAIAARCADDQIYQMLDALYASVEHWSRKRDIDAALLQKAASLGLDEKSFRAGIDEPQNMSAITNEKHHAATKYGILGTPTFLINGKVVPGEKNNNEMEALIEQALSNTGNRTSGLDD